MVWHVDTHDVTMSQSLHKSLKVPCRNWMENTWFLVKFSVDSKPWMPWKWWRPNIPTGRGQNKSRSSLLVTDRLRKSEKSRQEYFQMKQKWNMLFTSQFFGHHWHHPIDCQSIRFPMTWGHVFGCFGMFWMVAGLASTAGWHQLHVALSRPERCESVAPCASPVAAST